MNYGGLLFRIAKRLLKESMLEIERIEVNEAQKNFLRQFQDSTSQHQVTTDLQSSFDTFKKLVLCTTPSKYTIGHQRLNSTLGDEDVKKSKDIVGSFKRHLLTIVMRFQEHVALRSAEAYEPLPEELRYIKEPKDCYDIRMRQLEKMCALCVFFKFNSLHDLHSSGFNLASAYELSCQNRKVTIQELMFVDYNSSINSNLWQRSTSLSVQIPINSHFDKVLFGTNVYCCRSTKDRGRPGLVNPYKSSYIKNNKVVWESIRSGSIPMIKINDVYQRTNGNEANARELLTVLAVNHCKRFTRAELMSMSSLNVPFTSLCLLTPFFLSGKEDLQTIEHHQAILAVIERGDVSSVTCCLTDDGLPITVNVTFQEACLLNIGVNVVMRTLLAGSGLQRAINCRRYGMRTFQNKVQNHLLKINNQKREARVQVVNLLCQLLHNPTVASLIQHIESCQLSLDQNNNRSSYNRQSTASYFLNKEAELERAIRVNWCYVDNSTNIELTYAKEIKAISNEIHEYCDRVYRTETVEWCSIYEALIQVESSLVNLISSSNIPNSQLLSEYCSMVQNEKDVFFLYADMLQMYYDGVHEKFSQGLVINDTANDVYSLPVRISMLSFLMSEQSHFNCKSGKDRTGELQDQCQEFAEIREHTKDFPRYSQEQMGYDDHNRHIHTMIAMNGGSLEIIKQNLGIIGSKLDTCISGRFLPGFYKKYKGLSSLDTTGISGGHEWKNYEEFANSMNT
ncbi:hypothetical protein AKO1_008195, partial [Acrasis kona]